MRTWPALVASGLTHTDVAPGLSRADSLQAALTDFSVAAIDEPSADSLRAFFQDAAERDRAVATLQPDFPDLTLAAVDVPDEDWAARSQASLTSIHVGALVIAPPWDLVPTPGVAADTSSPAATPGVGTNAPAATPGVRIVILPSMGFGTGHHATTRLCLAALQRANVRDRSVLDVGTGSGVLAIAASLLGASPVVALDDDPDAIQSAHENLELNPRARVDVRSGDLRSSILDVASVVIANLTGTLLIQAAPQLQHLVAPRGRMILSGLLDHEEASVIAAFQAFGVLDRMQENEWVCLVLGSHQAFE